MKRPAKKPKHQPPRRRERVLVVVRDGRLIEAYADDHVDVHIVNRLAVEGERGALATLCDEYLESTLPRSYRGLHWPRNLRAIGCAEIVTPEEAADTLYQLFILRALRAERESERQPPAAIARERRAIA